MSFSFPPLARRIVAQRHPKSNVISLIEQVCILPIGGGLWFPVRNLTRSLSRLEAQLAVTETQLQGVKASIAQETSYINKEMERIGFYADAALVKDPKSGEFKIVDLRSLVDFRLGNNSRGVVATEKEKVRKEVFANLLIETRKPKEHGNDNKKKQQQ